MVLVVQPDKGSGARNFVVHRGKKIISFRLQCSNHREKDR